MGTIIQAQAFSLDKHKGVFKPIIYCCSYGNSERDAISINKLLAEIIIKYPPINRTFRLEKCFNQILDTLDDDIVIKDFEVMFNPEYKVDILKIMVEAGKKKSYDIIWPGKYKDGKLFYAEEGYLDYKVFNVEEYDITCIVREE